MESKAMWEDESSHDITIICDHFNHYDVDWVFGFHYYEFPSRLTQKPSFWHEWQAYYFQSFWRSGLVLYPQRSSVCFHYLIWIFDSGLKWWTEVSSWVTKLQRKFFGLTWKQVRTVLEMLTLFSSCCVSILGPHLADSLSISKLSVKTVWTKPEMKPMDTAICWIVIHLSSRML